MRTIDWDEGAIVIVDQTALPGELRLLRLTSVDELIGAIQRLAVRGAPALGVAGAMGVALIAQHAEIGPRAGAPGSADGEALAPRIAALRAARPTATNLAWGVDRAAAFLSQGAERVLAEALAVRDEDEAASRRMGLRGADLLRELVRGGEGEDGAPARPLRLLTHCNTGALAAVTWGTALGVARALLDQGDLGEVIATETRPLLQGARLTVWELREMGAPHRLIVDGAGPSVMARGLVDAIIVGADRICANGDVANKVGTYSLALGAARAGLPFVVVAPESSVDMDTPSGDQVAIEDRPDDEVTGFRGTHTAPDGTVAINPAFDVTPHDLITAIVTDRRVVRLDRGEDLARAPLSFALA
ncbi:MAG TPA: S-methyl-5-thioribose-1-phosphate isomerase [Candidatus Limnocylindrales bacterium]|nr:S-methyl-5-thioribose-1-phosphate isomerase [Candidatus Limnocylindrales bacterium]